MCFNNPIQKQNNLQQLSLCTVLVLFALSSTFPYSTLLFPPPSCSISTSVTTLTFPPLYLPLSSSSVSSFLSLLSLNPSSVTQQPSQKFNYNQDVCLYWLVRGGWVDGGEVAIPACHCLKRKPFTHPSARISISEKN